MTKQLTGPGLASRADFGVLADLWARSFDDSERYIRNFQSLLAEPENTVVYREKGQVVSCAYLLPAVLHIGDNTYNAYYFYAAATDPDYRRRGYMEQVIRYSRTLCEERDIDFLILVPAGNDLYQYYSRFGFRANFYLKTTQLDREQLLALVEKLDPAAPESDEGTGLPAPTEMLRVRRESLAGGSYLDFDGKTLQYMLFEHLYCGGKTLLTEDGYVLYDLKEDDGTVTLNVKELCSSDAPEKLLRPLSAIEADRYVLNLPAFDSIRGGKTSTGRAGMDLAVTPRAVKAERTMKNAYIGLTLG
ncbi:MAG: GNAT family N-acetyltransferase [Clostridia bacterium]|nr:GNAT family N-acetyltransferase [Clostridia bacterium]